MCLVDGDQRDIQAGQEPIGLGLDPLRRDIEQLDFSLYAQLLDLLLFFLWHHAVQGRGRYAVGDQSFYLVFHQGDQRGDHQSRPWKIDSR